ncbi:MAG: MFS transporter, partial [Pseudomonadota bacterium]
FSKHRGIALGITMTGIGCTAAVLPPILAMIIKAHGWREGYYALALIPLAGAAITVLLFPARPIQVPGSLKAPDPRSRAKATWLQSRVFWILAGTFAAMSLSFGGLLPHFVPMLRDGGLDALAAARIAGEIGLAVIASRMLVGFLLDRIFAPHIAIVICLIAAAGSLAFIVSGISSASLTAIAIGFALGAELDLMGYLVARYFGLENFGRIYGLQYGAFIFASGLGPLWVGFVRDATGNYIPALVVSTIGLVVTCGGFLLLPRYPSLLENGNGARPAG